jgi:hypothetical protein
MPQAIAYSSLAGRASLGERRRPAGELDRG